MGFLQPCPRYDSGRSLLVHQQFLHLVHIGSHMRIEHVISVAQGIQAGLAGLCPVEPVFRTFTVAGKEVFALHTFVWKPVPFLYPEFHLLVGGHHLPQVLFVDIAQKVFRVDEVVARVQIPVVLYDGIAATGLGIYACSGLLAAPACKSGIEQVHEPLSDVIPDPPVENVAHEPAVCHRPDRPWGYHGTFLGRIHDMGPRPLVGPAVRKKRIFYMLDYRHKLHIFGTQRLEKLIDLQSATFRSLVYGRHCIVFDSGTV